MNWRYYAITLGLFLMVASVIINDLTRMKKDNEKKIIEQPKTTDIDGLLNEIDTLQIKSDTIKLYYEKKVSNYNILPRSKRVRLFSDRINR
jgi:hypothetical protein